MKAVRPRAAPAVLLALTWVAAAAAQQAAPAPTPAAAPPTAPTAPTAPAPAPDPDPRLAQLEERRVLADGFYARGMWKEAAAEYEGILKEKPDAPLADAMHFRLGECHRQRGDVQAAEQEFRRVYVDYPASAFRQRAGFRRASLFLDTGHADGAADLFREVLDQKPPDDMASAALYLLGEALLKTGKPAEARDAFERLNATYADSEFGAFAQLKLGQIYGGPENAGGNAEKALAAYRRALVKPPSPRVAAEATFQMAELLYRRGDFKASAEAYAALRQSWPADPRTAESRLRAAWAAQGGGLYADALKQAEAALAAAPARADLAEWLYLKANAQRQLVRHAEAAATYAELLTSCADSRFAQVARYEKALCAYKQGDYPAAVADAERVQVTPQLKKDVYWLLAESYAALQKGDEAIQYYRLLVREFPDSDVAADATYRLAYHLQGRAQYAEAAQYYGSVAARFPNAELAPKALLASAFCLGKAAKPEEALRDLTELVKKYPASPLAEEGFYQKGMNEVRLRRDAEALLSLRELVRRFPGTAFAADAHYWQGVLFQDAKKWQDAEASLRAALAARPGPDLTREAQYALAVVLNRQEKFDESAALLLALFPTPMRDKYSPPLLKWLAEYLLSKGQNKEAGEVALHLGAKGPAPVWQQTGWCLAGRARQALQARAEAEQAFQNALALPVTTVYAAEAALRLGELRLADGKTKEAEEFLRKAATMASDDSMLAVRARAYAGLGRAAAVASDFQGAARYYMSVAILYEDAVLVPECLYEAAMAFRKAGDASASSNAVGELLKRYPQSDWATKATTPAP